MHDSQIEEQLRGVLRAEGDAIPLTITTAELERRLAARRRATGGRRLSWVAAAAAAIAVVSIVAAGNGWLRLPAIGTVASPSPSASAGPTAERSAVPSFKPVPGVGRIESPAGSTVLTEVLPTTFAAVDRGSFDADLPPEQYDVTVQLLCVGSNVTLTEGSREWPTACYAGADPNPSPARLDIPVVDGHLALRWTADPNVGYTILVTTSPLPTSLPALEPFDATTATIIDASSAFDRPLTGSAGTLVTQPVGILPDATDYEINLVCLGPGEMPYSLGQPGRADFVMSSTITCDGQPKRESYSNGGGAIGPHEVYLSTDSRTAWHARIGVTGAAPSASPTQPPSARSPLGRPDQAILVRPIGASWTTPDSLEVTLFDPADQSSDLIATIPGSVVPAGKWISTDAKPVVSASGWLAIPIRPGPDTTDTESAIVFVDLLDPTAPSKSLVGPQSGSWNGDDTFAAITEGGVQIYDPATGFVGMAPITDPAVHAATLGGPATDPIWTTTANSRFLGTRNTEPAAQSGPQGWGVISVDGTFSATTDLPPTYQRTGLERPTGADAHQFTLACTGGGTITEAGCSLVEIDPSGAQIATRVNATDYPYLADSAWAADGRDAWLLFGTAPDGGRGDDGVASLALSKQDGTRQEYSTVHVGGGNFAILGVSQSPDGLPIVAIGSRSSWLRAFVAAQGGDLNAGSPGYSIGLEETSWFAGWAGPQPDYDPD